MLEIYLTGAFLMLGINIVRIVKNLSAVVTMRTRNLKKVGIHYNPFIGSMSKDKHSILTLPFTLFDMLIITPALSWISVLMNIVAWVRILFNRVPIPEKVKEYRFKLSTMDLPKEKMKEMARELGDSLNIPFADDILNEEQDDEVNGNTLVTDTGTFNNEFTIQRSEKKFFRHYHTDDWDVEIEETYDYILEDKKVIAELVEKRTRLGGERFFEVKDGVVQESALRERESGKKFSLKSIDEKLSELKAAVSPEELMDYRLRYWILSKHPEMIPEQDFRKFLRQESERIKAGTSNIKALAQENGFVIGNFEEFVTINLPDSADATGKSEPERKYEELFGNDAKFLRAGISRSEFECSTSIETTILKLLGEFSE